MQNHEDLHRPPPAMSRRCLLSLATAVSVVALLLSPSLTSGFPHSDDIETVRRIVDSGLRGNYAAAESLAVELQDSYPDHPIGFVLHAAMLQSRMLDEEHFDYQDEFYGLTTLAERRCKSALMNSPSDAWVLYCRGIAQGARAVHDFRAGSWWSAVKNGIRSKGSFSECIKSDRDFYDACLGLGSYHYWRTAKTKAINWLPFVQDDREQGLAELALAADSSLFSADLARNALIWIWLDMGRYEEAESLSVEMQNKYPEGHKFLWSMAYARIEQDDFPGAEAVLIEIITRLSSDSATNNYNIVDCRHRLAAIYLETGRYAECLEQCRLVRELDLEDSVRKRLKGRLSEVNSFEKKAGRAIERVRTGA